jgi:hypothetical protein
MQCLVLETMETGHFRTLLYLKLVMYTPIDTDYHVSDKINHRRGAPEYHMVPVTKRDTHHACPRQSHMSSTKYTETEPSPRLRKL